MAYLAGLFRTALASPERPVTDQDHRNFVFEPPGLLANHMTPAELQSTSVIARRRGMVLVLNLAAYLGLLAWIGTILASGGWSLLGALLFACFAFGMPWTVLGFWNAVIGYWILRGVSDGLARVAPFVKAAEGGSAPLYTKTAILLTLRNENPTRAFRRL